MRCDTCPVSSTFYKILLKAPIIVGRSHTFAITRDQNMVIVWSSRRRIHSSARYLTDSNPAFLEI